MPLTDAILTSAIGPFYTLALFIY